MLRYTAAEKLILMRSADLITYLRVALVILVIYFITLKINPAILIVLFAIALIMDGLDGYFAVLDVSNGKIGFIKYAKAAIGYAPYAKEVKKAKIAASKSATYGARLDVAGDRIIEYSLWALFTYLGIVPFFVFIIVIIRHSIVDSFMGSKGTSSKMKTKLGRALYSSSASRAGINILKFITFSYLMLIYISNYPLSIGYALTGALVLFIVVRGVAEVYESFA